MFAMDVWSGVLPQYSPNVASSGTALNANYTNNVQDLKPSWIRAITPM